MRRRLAARREPVKAIVAVQHAIRTAIWNMGTNGTLYDDPGADFLHPTPPRKKEDTAPSNNSALPRANGDTDGLFATLLERFAKIGGTELDLPERSTPVRAPDLSA